MFNSYVHVGMYFYYFLTALGPQFRRFAWWKQYLTIIQLVRSYSNESKISAGVQIEILFLRLLGKNLLRLKAVKFPIFGS
jgi:hypothetical protein